MSKAFTRESDDLPEPPVRPRSVVTLPQGTKNYLTPAGAKALREELQRLTQVEYPRLTALPDGPETRRELQTLNDRVLHLQQSLATAEIVPPPAARDDQVHFGATVTVRDRSGEATRYRIVGVDETDLDRNWISWLSPLARALLKARLGQRVRIRLPLGDEELEIVAIDYE